MLCDHYLAWNRSSTFWTYPELKSVVRGRALSPFGHESPARAVDSPVTDLKKQNRSAVSFGFLQCLNQREFGHVKYLAYPIGL